MGMFQIIFSPAAATDLERLPRELQLYILGQFRGLPQDIVSSELDEKFGRLRRGRRTLYRMRLEDYRVYFERHKFGIIVHRILNRNTLEDFMFRSGLPLSEDKALEEDPRFWALIEATETTPPDGKLYS